MLHLAEMCWVSFFPSSNSVYPNAVETNTPPCAMMCFEHLQGALLRAWPTSAAQEPAPPDL